MNCPVIRVWPALPKAVIRPEIYGHFAEHLGRCVYEGIWVGERSRIPHENGLRLDVLAALKHLHAPVMRWPGGCFADDYHWRDGVGPRKERPQTANIWWQQGEPNEFGTPEFMRLCHASGTAPYLCANVGSGSPAEARDWVEYCNFGGDSALSSMRGRDGSPEPHGVRWWGVGNESWGCGGRMDAGDYARQFARFGNFMKAVDPSIHLVACGAQSGTTDQPGLNEWNHDFCAQMKHADLLECLSLHRYFSRGTGADFSDGDFRATFADVLTLERDLQRTRSVLDYFYPDRLVKIAVDEWGMWHPEARVENGLEQAHTLRDALLAGSVLNLFNRWSHRVAMANIAQTVNVLHCLAVTQGNRMFLTPTYHVFDLMRHHMGARALMQEVDSPTYAAHPVGSNHRQDVPVLDASSSLAGKKLLITVVNRAVDEDLETAIELHEVGIAAVTGKVLGSGDPRDGNSMGSPSAVKPKTLRLEPPQQNRLVHVFPRHSLTALSVTLE